MKVVLWPLHYLPMIGGAEVQVHHLALGLQKKGVEVIAIANQIDGLYSEDIYEGVPVFRFPFVSALNRRDLKQIKEVLARVARLVADFQPDIVHTQALVEQINFYQNRVPVSFKLCATTHGGLIEKIDCQKRECVQLCTKADMVSAPAAHFLSELKLSHNRSRVIPNGLPEVNQPLSPLPNNHVIVAIGRLASEKGFDVAIGALDLLKTKFPEIELLLIGDGPEKESLSHPKLRKVGTMAPHQVYQWIDRAQIVVIPSTHECLNLVAIEAAMRGRPVIASDICGLNETVEDQVTGFLIEPRNSTLLAEKIEYLFSHPELARQIGMNAHQKIREKYSYEKTVELYLKMYSAAQTG